MSLLVAGLILGFPTAPASAMSPTPFFQQISRIGILCAVDAEPQAAALAPEAGRLCSLAAEELRALLGRNGPMVTTLAVNDERFADPSVLVVLLHAHTRMAAASLTAALTALAVTLYRSRPDLGAPPFFIVPPEALSGTGGPPAPEALRDALNRLLKAAVAFPVLANRKPTPIP